MGGRLCRVGGQGIPVRQAEIYNVDIFRTGAKELYNLLPGREGVTQDPVGMPGGVTERPAGIQSPKGVTTLGVCQEMSIMDRTYLGNPRQR